MYKLSTMVSISSAHFLKHYDGDCARLHGHNWKVKVDVAAQTLNDSGMAVDFKELKKITWQAIGKYDHQVFNEVAPFDKLNPTAENIARHFYNEIAALLPDNIKMSKISLWETEKYLVEYSE